MSGPGDGAPGPPGSIARKDAMSAREPGEPPPVAPAAGDKAPTEPAVADERVQLLFAQLEQVIPAVDGLEHSVDFIAVQRSYCHSKGLTVTAPWPLSPPAAAAAFGGGGLQGLRG